MLPTLQPRDYSEKPSGFFHLYSHRKYLGFISDVEDTNRVYLLTHPISRSEIEQLFTRTVTALHREWCSDIKKGMRGPDVEQYWEEKDKESEQAREQERLIGASRARVAKMMEVVVTKEATEKTDHGDDPKRD